MKIASLLAIFLGLAGTGAVAAPQTRVCAKYSTILLEEGERAEVDGAGPFSVSLRITGSRGNWIFYDSLSEPSSADSEGTLVPTGPDRIAYRRSHDSHIYSVHPAQSALIDGKIVKTGVMGVDFMRSPLDNPAIMGDNSDIDVIERVLPGVTGGCDLQFVAGEGLVSSASK